MQRRSPAITGAIAGSVAGAVARFVVALGFILYVSRWGGRWWEGAGDMWLAAFVSGLIGAVVGAVAGWTCKPVAGAAIGALLSGGTCFTFFVLPAELMIGMSHPGGFDRVETAEVLFGFAAMTLAGAVAGLVGGTIGRRAKQATLGPEGEGVP